MIVRRAEVIPMECVVRGYLYGSSWEEYAAGGGPTTEHLPAGLAMAERLDQPIFTPATKADTGHDENLTEAGARALVGDDRYEELEGAQHRHLPAVAPTWPPLPGSCSPTPSSSSGSPTGSCSSSTRC